MDKQFPAMGQCMTRRRKRHIYLTPLHQIFDSNFNLEVESNYKRWFDDIFITKYNSHGLFPFNPINGIEDYLSDPSRIVWAIIHKIPDNQFIHIGNVSLDAINLLNRSADITCVIGEDNYWHDGIMTWACQKIISHGFMKLGLNRIYSGTAATNIGMQKVFDKLKFSLEGVFSEGTFLNGEFVDVWAYGLTKTSWMHVKVI